MKKTLVYHLYVMDNCRENFVYGIHRICLNKYIHIFDEIKIVVCVNDLSKHDLILFGYEWILSLNIRCPLQINILKNDELGESRTFKREVVECGSDGMVFFAHSKGVTYYENKTIPHSILHWVAVLYFYNLENTLEVETEFNNGKLSMGALYGDGSKYNNCLIPNHYEGAFFWVNMNKYKMMQKVNAIPKVDALDRGFAEMYFGNVYKIMNHRNIMGSYSNVILGPYDINSYCADETEWLSLCKRYGRDTDYMDFVRDICKQINYVIL